MNKASHLMAAAALLLLHPGAAHAQPSPGTATEHTYTYPQAPRRGPGWGFATGMRPGPGNSYNYPYVRTVISGSAAEAAGLMVGDTIISVDGRDMRYGPFFPVQVAGTRYVMLVRRGTEEIELVYTFPKLEEAPREGTPAAPPE